MQHHHHSTNASPSQSNQPPRPGPGPGPGVVGLVLGRVPVCPSPFRDAQRSLQPQLQLAAANANANATAKPRRARVSQGTRLSGRTRGTSKCMCHLICAVPPVQVHYIITLVHYIRTWYSRSSLSGSGGESSPYSDIDSTTPTGHSLDINTSTNLNINININIDITVTVTVTVILTTHTRDCCRPKPFLSALRNLQKLHQPTPPPATRRPRPPAHHPPLPARPTGARARRA